ncbi:DUF6438 domain-containing protein [Longimicrobium sp.]|uniref:DUF6438 domain-containing protein n=1 Tax=Longimicrobium sp. TaxID=2029185 RepID=UPI002BE45A4E|nr:DUF6438 domain-containing protein [Longimicrobium sp.]HSU15080.1 DUF6438 domain-containing protein [Longimicrobium sp.]
MRKLGILAAMGMAAAAACTRPAAVPPAGGASARADSIVLERTRCYGFCPAYRLVLARTGEVRFTSIWPADTPPGSGTVAVRDFDALVDEAGRIGFWSLPDEIQGSSLCPNASTDSPSTIVTLHAAGRFKRVNDYHGCREEPRLTGLRVLEARIDSVAGSRRWIVTPNTR